jgi:hypothetical protein
MQATVNTVHFDAKLFVLTAVLVARVERSSMGSEA